MNVRRANAADIPAVIRMGRKFHESTPYADVAYDPDSIRFISSQLIEGGILLIADHEGESVGMLGAAIGPLFMNRDALVCSELFWWVEPEGRNTGAGRALVERLESECISIGVYRLAMVGIHGPQMAKTAAMYERMDFAPTEQTWSKSLWQR